MADVKQPFANDDAIYGLTRKGEEEIRGAKTTLPSFALELLIRIDGRTSLGSIRAGMSNVSQDTFDVTVESLLHNGIITRVKSVDDGTLEFEGPSGFAAPLVPSAAAMSKASREASAGVTSLQQQGYFVRIAKRPAGRPQLPSDRKPLAIVVEDEPHLAKFLKHFLGLEGFEVRLAATRDEIVQTIRQPPRPDLVLLDVMLPDADGFDVLMKIREHPALREVPIIMLTAKTTREAVIKGLAGGADGYITKPFQTDVLVKAIKPMFGMSDVPGGDTWRARGV
jgi:two-component system, OmpR family, response regulator